ncbi:ectoine/hydroxyectoine ABC transporter permease subunit EhuD [Streptomyces sp. NBC_01232]|uniref:ectoine/hydroxyectoine ABC transporter permease subunit EhuD n=1 Tax=Streptomyces TaxID=1883 RepID=UPI00207AE40D|nr:MULTISPECIES: ectoine/hydroxyectoine ABC transporter permease subunit EhuD [Streptomyces]MCM9083062.1 ectoine/hydroxyectoine ABC transporter permease subunit EhuD [Streptomyces spororaveus]MCX4717170.1 ectoine/hydroxyectoine ABC transporter permease subunit EhuD [Streptomyces virginiae]MCX4806941.1 ectoine/hydroxyectoine ABC transporter permease subunit EhuD [Streptomyces sp. NBC_01214]WSQ01853.1 ectoine/hydroxyectoine ABC transporter permease subunit EhuD [Streptomyces sp. NBC_01232]
MWSWETAREGLPVVLSGFGITLLATVLGSAVAMLLGLVLAVALRTPTRWVTLPLRVIADFVRSTPLMIQLFAAWVLVPGLNALTLGIAVLGIHYATYTCEVYRAGIDAVPRGQWEACTALSLPRRRVWRAVILPQAVRNVLPALGNYVISMFKETPFLSVIAVQEMVHRANEYGSVHFAYLEAFTLAATVFLLASYPTSVLMRRLEKRLAR